MKSRMTYHGKTTLLGWLIAAVGTAVYLMTLEPSVSFWDCGEFIATSYKLQVGHPPGAPVYQLLAHCFMLLAGHNTAMLAWWSNCLSAHAGGLTAMFLFWTLVRLLNRIGNGSRHYAVWIAAATGSACYLFCDTAWFSAVESEVYSLSMLFSSVVVWAMLRWAQCEDDRYAPRWLMLVGFLLGLSAGVHLLALLTVPALLLIYIVHRRGNPLEGPKRARVVLGRVVMGLFLFAVGLTPYIIIPIRAAADTPINQGDPSSWESFKSYITREQYEHAPLLYGRCFNSPVVGFEDGKPVYAKEMDMFFPRMWKQHPHAEEYYTDWTGRHGKMVDVNGHQYYKPSFGDNLVFFAGYQVGYMNLRYLMWNFSGRYSDRQGFGNIQKGQFITGIGPLDRLYVGTSDTLPASIQNKGHNRYFLLPFILGIVGLFFQRKRDRKGYWTVMVLFLMSSLALSVYLNHPVYEPRERDYAYVPSFYTFAIWIGMGAYALGSIEWRRLRGRMPKVTRNVTILLCAGVPLLMACQNWDDHDRSRRYIARDSAANLLQSCAPNAILFTYGDNDTYPLWYLQQVEDFRTDVQVINISLLGSDSYTVSTAAQLACQGSDLLPDDSWKTMGPYMRMKMIVDNNAGERPVYFSHYAYNVRKDGYKGRMKLCGIAFQLADTVSADTVDVDASFRLMTDALQWNSLEGVYVDEVSHTFLVQYWNDALLVAANLVSQSRAADAVSLLERTWSSIPLELIQDPMLKLSVAKVYRSACENGRYAALRSQVEKELDEQLAYYGSMSPTMQRQIPYTLAPLMQLRDSLIDNVSLP